MTLIVYHGFGKGLRPFFVSDLLISSEFDDPPFLTLPSLGNVRFIYDGLNRYRIVGLGQKVTILTDNLIVAASGSVIYYQVFAKYLGALFDQLTVTSNDDVVETIKEYLSQEDTQKSLENMCGFIHYVTKSHGVNAYFDSSPGATIRYPHNVKSPIFDHVLAYGSGASTYIDNTSKMRVLGGGLGGPNALYDDVALVFALVGRFLAKEVNSNTGHLNEYCGGGFEITAFADERFHKLDDVLYLISTVVAGTSWKDTVISPRRIIKFKYVREHLFIRCLTLNKIDESICSVEEDVMLYVPPFLKTTPTPTPMDVRIEIDENEWFCWTAFFSGQGGYDNLFVIVVPRYGLPIQRLPYSLREVSGMRLEINLSEEFRERLREAVWENADAGMARISASIWPFPGVSREDAGGTSATSSGVP